MPAQYMQDSDYTSQDCRSSKKYPTIIRKQAKKMNDHSTIHEQSFIFKITATKYLIKFSSIFLYKRNTQENTVF